MADYATEHYEPMTPEGGVRRVDIPGYTAPIWKSLFPNQPVRIRQYGFVTGSGSNCANAVANIQANVNNPNVTTNVATKIHGTYNNCFKRSVRFPPLQSGDGGKVRYEIIWEQLTA
jgi:hypothetical protein